MCHFLQNNLFIFKFWGTKHIRSAVRIQSLAKFVSTINCIEKTKKEKEVGNGPNFKKIKDEFPNVQKLIRGKSSSQTSTKLRLFQTCVNCMRLRSKIENFLTGCVFRMRKKQPRLVRFMQYV